MLPLRKSMATAKRSGPPGNFYHGVAMESWLCRTAFLARLALMHEIP